MIQDDLAKENSAIKQYKEHIKLAIEEDDPTTRLMLEEILSDEEDHADTWKPHSESRNDRRDTQLVDCREAMGLARRRIAQRGTLSEAQDPMLSQ